MFDMEINNLGEVIEFNSSFKTAINLYLSLNKTEKVLNYIPTKSSVNFMDDYLQAVLGKKEHATLLVGPYGKGKSHLLLVLLAVLSLERNSDNEKIINQLKSKLKGVEEIGNKACSYVEKIWKSKRYLPVIINDTKGDLNQAFLGALSDALKRENLEELAPDTFFSEAIRRTEEWEKEYPETFKAFSKELKVKSYDIEKLRTDLKEFSKEALNTFRQIYPKVTAGSTFNPLATSDVLPLYRSVSDVLVENYNFAGIYIVFDEFSKFIEGLDGTNAGHTMKLLQDMCELAEDSSNAQIFLTMVAHKSIKEYGKYLSQEIINAFTGIEGRIIEKYFVTSSKNNYELIRNAIVKKEDGIKRIPSIEKYIGEEALVKYYQLPAFKSNFSKTDFESIILKGCYPLNPIAAYLLLNISEKVAQNERTLFTFISNDEPNSLARFVAEHDAKMGWIIGADLIYDYFCGLFKKEVSNELVHSIWLDAEYALSKCNDEEEKKLIKTLALISIVNKPEEILANEKNLSLAASLIDGNATIATLSSKQLIYKKSSIGAFVFKTRAGSELKAEIKKQREIKGNNCKYAKTLQLITGKYFVVPRRYNTEMMMTRYFRHEFMNVDSFFAINNADAFFDHNDSADGKVITLFSFGKTSQAEIKNHFMELKCKKLIVVAPNKMISVAKALRDYEILQDIRTNQSFIEGNEVLQREIPLLEEDLVKIVEDELEIIYSSVDTKVFYWSADKVKTGSQGQEENAVNKCCEELYSKTPIINNEIINRVHILTAQTKKARLNIIGAILQKSDTEDFYGGTNQEATIYRSVFHATGITRNEPDSNIEEIVSLLNEFVDSCSDNKLSFVEIISKLTDAPYGMRLGVIPLFLAKVLSNRGEDLVAYFSNMEVPITPEIIVNMCEKPDEYSLFVSKKDYDKEVYINNLNDLFAVNDGRALTENRIKNIVLCMQRWFRALPQIARNNAGIEAYGDNDILKRQMRIMKKLLQKVEVNPYEVLFVNIPSEFRTMELDNTYVALKECKKAYDDYLSWTIKRATDGIYKVFGGQRKLDLYHLLKEWYEKQSDLSKQGLHSASITSFMSCIEKMDTYGDTDVAQKIVKAVTNVYIENWIDNAYEDFISGLTSIKTEIEHIREEKSEGKLLLSFTGSKGNKIERYYEKVDEGTGTILRNIIEDTLDEYDDLSVNDRVGILLEMIEKIIG
jgi:hypothetical protein